MSTVTHDKKSRRIRRVRSKMTGTKEKPRLCVYRSNKYIYAQLIDDEARKTIASENDRRLDNEGEKMTSNPIERAKIVGKKIAERAIKKGVTKVIFDRGGYRYLGRVKAVAEGARKNGLNF